VGKPAEQVNSKSKLLDFFGREICVGDIARPVANHGDYGNKNLLRVISIDDSAHCTVSYCSSVFHNINGTYRGHWLAVLPSSILARGE